jgi:hypothetical protein
MSATRLAVDALWRLAHRVVQGEVVFFVGAGFSIDNEGNTTSRLTGRLLIRFEAWTLLLEAQPPPHLDARAASSYRKVAARLRDDFQRTFSLEQSTNSPATFLALSSNETAINQVYYQFNDWICSAFGELLSRVDGTFVNAWKDWFTTLNVRENSLRENHRVGDTVPLEPVDLDSLLRLTSHRDRAKALFLQTLGFNGRSVMAGDPVASNTTKVEESYGGKLRPRQHVLARLAREGLGTTLVTTNFDLLLEGAYRIAGFRMHDPRDAGKLGEQVDPYPPVTFQELRCVSCAPHFSQRGDQRRLATLLKLHGDVREYGQRADDARDGTPESERSWSAYLKSMIFTFREIQNWREDFWSQDLIRTLLRSRTMAFCGYSGADPVLHDTFRSVYEEMERSHQRHRHGVMGAARPQPAALSDEDAPAFFFDLASAAGFHAAEIMGAASRGVGIEHPLRREHPNRIAYNGKGTFPDLDDSMVWLLHAVIRERQRQAIETDLGRTVASLLGRPCPRSTSVAILKSFDKLLADERSRVENLAPAGRGAFDRVVSWTQEFHVGLLREFAIAEQLLRDFRPGQRLQQLRRWPWYYPTSDHPEWTAWSAVLELAIRRLTASWRRAPSQWATDATYAVGGEHPTVAYQGSPRPRTPSHLTILLHGFQRPGYPPRPTPSRLHHNWELDVSAIPWAAQCRGGTPGVEALLLWAAGLGRQPDSASITRFLDPTGAN